MSGKARTSLFGTPKQVAVERGLAEFRSGRPVIITTADATAVALPVDGMTDHGLAAFRQLSAPGRPYLLITARRARALGLSGAGPMTVDAQTDARPGVRWRPFLRHLAPVLSCC